MRKTAIRWRDLLRGPGCAVLLSLLAACAPFGGAPPGRPASAASASNAPASNAPASNAPAASAPASNAPAASAPAAPRAVAGSVAEREFLGTAAPAEIDRAERRFYVYGNALPAQYPVDWFQIRFMTADGQGGL